MLIIAEWIKSWDKFQLPLSSAWNDWGSLHIKEERCSFKNVNCSLHLTWITSPWEEVAAATLSRRQELAKANYSLCNFKRKKKCFFISGYIVEQHWKKLQTLVSAEACRCMIVLISCSNVTESMLESVRCLVHDPWLKDPVDSFLINEILALPIYSKSLLLLDCSLLIASCQRVEFPGINW